MSARATNQVSPDDDRKLVSPAVLWFGVAAGPIVWFIHLGLSYLLETRSCVSGMTSTELWLHGVTLVSVIVVVTAGLLSWRGWHSLRVRGHHNGGAYRGRVEFMLLSGVLLSGLFALTIIVADIPILFLDHCA